MPGITPPVNTTPSTVIRTRIKWLLANDNNGWKSFDDDVSEILRTSKGDDGRWLRTMSTKIVSYATERFGLIEAKKGFNNKDKNRREITDPVIKSRS